MCYKGCEKMANSGNVVFLFLIYSTAILTLPLLTFFGVKNILEKEFHITGFSNTAWSVICAVIVVNLIIMAYAWKAYKQEVAEEDETTESEQLVQSKEDLKPKKTD